MVFHAMEKVFDKFPHNGKNVSIVWKNRGSGNEPRFPSRGARLWLPALAAWGLVLSASASRFPSPGQLAGRSFEMACPSADGMVATSVSAVVVGATVYGHDANGNLTNDATFAYRYDALNRLTNVVRKADGASVLANRYDGLGRRVEAVRNGTDVERYVYVPGTFLVLAVLDGSNNVKEIFAHGPDLSGTLDGAGGIGGILSQTAGTNTTYLHADISGNIAFASDASGNLVGTNRYTPYGSLISQMGAHNGRFMFSSKEWEPGAGLYCYGYRFYSPSLGRWLSRDPLGEFADPLHNLYRFVGNNPLNAVDPDGRQAIQNRIDFYMPGYGASQSYQMMGVNTRLLSVNNIQIYGATAQFIGRAAIESSFVGDLETLQDPTANWIWKTLAMASIVADATGVGEAIPSTGAMRCAAKTAKGLGRYDVGSYNILREGAESGLDAHHVGQKALMRQFVDGYDIGTAPSILVPKAGHTIGEGVVSRNMSGFNGARDVIARDILELRRVYPDIPNTQLQRLIELNKQMYPEVRR